MSLRDLDFYPRPHMEGDVCVSTTATGGSFISTHALTWRATRRADKVLLVSDDFYPRPHMEGDIVSSKTDVK